MAQPRSDTAAKRAKRWNLQVRHALYRRTGDWYHQLKRFPGALLDAEGYIVFETEASYHACRHLRINQDVGVPQGISSIPGYTKVSADADFHVEPYSYEQVIATEGARIDVVQTRPERNPANRAACLKAHGRACIVCSIDLGKRYGPLGEGFIHVHHLTPLSKGERDVDPVADLRPLCPNRHAMAHRRDPPVSIEELKATLRES